MGPDSQILSSSSATASHRCTRPLPLLAVGRKVHPWTTPKKDTGLSCLLASVHGGSSNRVQPLALPKHTLTFLRMVHFQIIRSMAMNITYNEGNLITRNTH